MKFKEMTPKVKTVALFMGPVLVLRSGSERIKSSSHSSDTQTMHWANEARLPL